MKYYILLFIAFILSCGNNQIDKKIETKIEATIQESSNQQNSKYKELFAQLKKNPMSANIYNQIGDLYFKDNDLENAELMFDFAIKLDSTHVPALFNKSILLMKTNKRDEAANCLQKAYDIEPDNIRVITNLAQYYYITKNNKKFLELTYTAYQLEPENSNLTYNMGIAYQNLGEYSSAIEYYEKTLQLNPQHQEAKNRLEILLHMQSVKTK